MKPRVNSKLVIIPLWVKIATILQTISASSSWTKGSPHSSIDLRESVVGSNSSYLRVLKAWTLFQVIHQRAINFNLKVSTINHFITMISQQARGLALLKHRIPLSLSQDVVFHLTTTHYMRKSDRRIDWWHTFLLIQLSDNLLGFQLME